MHFLHRSQSCNLLRRRCCRGDHIRTLYDAVSSIRCPRDRGLDHAVERERHLKPLVNLKNLIISEPSQSVPLSLINDSRRRLQIPLRPMDFIRKYASAFEEFHPSTLDVQPHIKLTPEIVSLNSEENLLYRSVSYREETARRLVKLLMVSRINKIPIFVLERLKWELGLPQDYEEVVIPEFPDYFRVIGGDNLRENGKVLELVCWIDELAVSEMEKKAAKDGNIQFPLQYSKGSEMDKKYEKWVDEWQKLPYVSPYENAMHLKATSDESDKWAVAVLHEVLNLFVGKKAERDSLLFLGECLGLRSRFKRVFLQHPGIFYVSSKIRTHTVILKEAYKRGMLIEMHPVMDMRFKYIQLMSVVKDDEKVKGAQEKSGGDEKKGGEELADIQNGEEDEAEMHNSESDESDDYEDAFDDDNEYRRGRFKRNDAFEERSSRRVARRTMGGRSTEENGSKSSTRFSRRMNTWDGDENKVLRRMNTWDGDENKFARRMNTWDGDQNRFSRRMNTQDGNRNRFSRRMNTRDGDENKVSRRMHAQDGDENKVLRGMLTRDGDQNRFSRSMNTRDGDENKVSRRMHAWDGDENKVSRRMLTRDGDENKVSRRLLTRVGDQNRFSWRMNTRDGDQNSSRTPLQKLNFSGNRARSKTEKSPLY